MRHRPVWRSFLLEQRALIKEVPRITAALPLTTAPTRVISGNRDTMIPPGTAAGLLAAIGHSTGHQVEAGHDLQLRQPAELAGLIAGWAVRRFGEVPEPAGRGPAVGPA
jgi:pimeloyl-ACP methyl ester carboxylesterase